MLGDGPRRGRPRLAGLPPGGSSGFSRRLGTAAASSSRRLSFSPRSRAAGRSQLRRLSGVYRKKQKPHQTVFNVRGWLAERSFYNSGASSLRKHTEKPNRQIHRHRFLFVCLLNNSCQSWSLLLVLRDERRGCCNVKIERNEIRRNELSERVMTPPNAQYTQCPFWRMLKGVRLKKKKKSSCFPPFPFTFQSLVLQNKLGFFYVQKHIKLKGELCHIYFLTTWRLGTHS